MSCSLVYFDSKSWTCKLLVLSKCLLIFQKLINAHRSQYETEYHMSKVADNEETSFVREMKDLDQLFDDLKHRDNFTESEFLRFLNGIIVKIIKIRLYCYSFPTQMSSRKSTKRSTMPDRTSIGWRTRWWNGKKRSKMETKQMRLSTNIPKMIKNERM